MMFWRVLRRLLQTNPARIASVLLALFAGAAVSAALLNLKVDAERRLTTEFRAFGANVMIAPRDSAEPPGTLSETVSGRIPRSTGTREISRASFLYVVATVLQPASTEGAPVVVGGFDGSADLLPSLRASAPPESRLGSDKEPVCLVGDKLVSRLRLENSSRLVLRVADREAVCLTLPAVSTGGPEDEQIVTNLRVVQRLSNLPDRIGLIQVSVPGTPLEIADFIRTLQQRIPEADVRGIRQFTEAEGRLYDKIRGLLTASVVLILALTGLCVAASMTNAAMERRHDVGLMKAIGGPINRVLRFFLTEAAVLGIVGGLFGAAVGIAVSVWLGKAVFGVAALPRLIVYPVTVALTVAVSILGAFPLRRLAGVKPAVIFRGEG